jgi:hypothetical protein
MSTEARRSIRLARLSDAEAIAGLLAELGYATDVDAARARLEPLLARDDAGVLVSELDGTVVAVAAYSLIALLYRSRPRCRITALVARLPRAPAPARQVARLI